MKKWIIGVYLRLSSDDRDKQESNSITNQRELILSYLNSFSDCTIYNIYIDDGYTGTDFDRPGYKDMLKDIRDKKINTIIVKDLSRIGRNYIEVGNFIDEVIPLYDLRFISINDNIDSYSNPKSMVTIEIPIKNLMNESYAKDISKKIRSSFIISKKSGKYIGVVAPYGYIKAKNDYHQLIIDEEAAIIVKKIFSLVLKGLSKRQIANKLNDLKIMTPSNYIYKKYNFNVGGRCDKWNDRMIDRILKNKMYTGSLIQGKSTRISHKIHNLVSVPEEEWIIVENCHEAIIDESEFKKVNDIIFNRDNKINKCDEYNFYSGHLKCSDCGASLTKATNSNKKNNVFYYCSSYKRKKICSKHYIKENDLNTIVLATINHQNQILCNMKEMINSLKLNKEIDINNEFNDIKQNKLSFEREKYNKFIKDLESDLFHNYITRDDYIKYKNKYNSQLNIINTEINYIKNNSNDNYFLKYLDNMKMDGKIKSLNKSLIDELIDNIYVYDDGSIKIYFKYKNEFEDAIKFLKSHNCMI